MHAGFGSPFGSAQFFTPAGDADGASFSVAEVLHFTTKEEAIDTLKEKLEPGAAMLVKASRFCHLEHTANYLREFKF